ncbi:MAG: hypothetical protein ACPGWR_24105 [Ardenticatenaceae bacterium]
MTTQCPIQCPINAGEASKYMLDQVVIVTTFLPFNLPSPASPLQNIDKH